MGMKEARERKGITQIDLARAVGVTVAAICRYENGVRTPSVAIAKRIEKVLGIPWPEIVDNKSTALGVTVDELIRKAEPTEAEGE